jgi:hypothetical protein
VRTLTLFSFAFILAVPTAPCAGETDPPCGKRAANSELSWNPAEQFVTPRLNRFYGVEEIMKSAYLAGNDDEVQSLASEYLTLASTYRCNWNYGNAIHDANRYLGLVSLRHGNMREAASYLQLSGKTPGSPQLNSFGPDLDLADGLLKRGEVSPVTQYLTDIKVFWKGGRAQIDAWLAAIAQGETPSLDRLSAAMNSSLVTGAKVFGWASPELIVLIALYVARKRLHNKLLFVVAATVVSYATSYLVNSVFGFVISKVVPVPAGHLVLIFLLGLLACAFPIAVVFAVSRYYFQGNELKHP